MSGFLNKIGMGSADLGLIVFILVILLVAVIVALVITMVSLNNLKKRYLRFSDGRDAKSLETEIGKIFEENNIIREQTDKNKKDIRAIYKQLEGTFQKIGLNRYDAFGQMGGQLSFALALLDENDNGFIINSIHGTEGCYTYSKEVKAGSCDIALGDEEQKALSMAIH